MNRALLGVLAGTGALSAWALLNPAPATNGAIATVVAAAPARPSTGNLETDSSPPTVLAAGVGAAPAASADALPAHWPAVNIEPATRNPFIVTPPPAPKPVVAAVVAPPPPAPPPPVSDYRFWGRVLVQGGQRLTYVARGVEGSPVAVDTGTRLDGGWAVESISDNAVVLVHSATQQHSTVSIPLHATSQQ